MFIFNGKKMQIGRFNVFFYCQFIVRKLKMTWDTIQYWLNDPPFSERITNPYRSTLFVFIIHFIFTSFCSTNCEWDVKAAGCILAAGRNVAISANFYSENCLENNNPFLPIIPIMVIHQVKKTVTYNVTLNPSQLPSYVIS